MPRHKMYKKLIPFMLSGMLAVGSAVPSFAGPDDNYIIFIPRTEGAVFTFDESHVSQEYSTDEYIILLYKPSETVNFTVSAEKAFTFNGALDDASYRGIISYNEGNVSFEMPENDLCFEELDIPIDSMNIEAPAAESDLISSIRGDDSEEGSLIDEIRNPGEEEESDTKETEATEESDLISDLRNTEKDEEETVESEEENIISDLRSSDDTAENDDTAEEDVPSEESDIISGLRDTEDGQDETELIEDSDKEDDKSENNEETISEDNISEENNPELQESEVNVFFSDSDGSEESGPDDSGIEKMPETEADDFFTEEQSDMPVNDITSDIEEDNYAEEETDSISGNTDLVSDEDTSEGDLFDEDTENIADEEDINSPHEIYVTEDIPEETSGTTNYTFKNASDYQVYVTFSDGSVYEVESYFETDKEIYDIAVFGDFNSDREPVIEAKKNNMDSFSEIIREKKITDEGYILLSLNRDAVSDSNIEIGIY